MSDKSINISGSDFKGNILQGDRNIVSSTNPSITQLPNFDDSSQPNINKLLAQLREAIATAPERDLSERRRNKALRLVQELAEAGKDPTNENNLDKADTAILNLNGIVVEMPRDSTTTQTINKIILEIKKYFML